MSKYLLSGIILLIWGSAAIASVALKPFQSDSLDEIVNDRKGQAFILVLWSVDCPPCLKELSQLQQLRHSFPKVGLVLVATDDAQYAELVEKIISDHQLDQMDNWIFNDTMPERLRNIIDPTWYGELPRAYFYDASHQRSAHSGALNKVMLEQWLIKTRVNPEAEIVRK